MGVLRFDNPFRPGAGHPPPYLAGRENEREEFAKLLDQKPVLANLVLTGLRGVGKTVLMETFKPLAISKGWLWAGTDLSESASIDEESIAIRVLADLAPLVQGVVVARREIPRIGFAAVPDKVPTRLDFDFLRRCYEGTPGLAADKLKAVLELVWLSLEATTSARGVVLAYDEAQNLDDHSAARQYPLSLLLDVLQSLQKKGFPYLVLMTGLPTLFPKLVEARTFAERMFRVTTLDRLADDECREAILKPMQARNCPVAFTEETVGQIVRHSGGYPYFVQYICREMFDSYLQQQELGIPPKVNLSAVVDKLDTDFFSGRWSRVTDRQRNLLSVVASLDNRNEEFSVAEIVERSRKMPQKPFGASQVSQMLAKLGEAGLVYRNRHGRYSFAIPLLGDFIRRLREEGEAT